MLVMASGGPLFTGASIAWRVALVRQLDCRLALLVRFTSVLVAVCARCCSNVTMAFRFGGPVW